MKRLSIVSSVVVLLVLGYAVSGVSDAFSMRHFLGLAKADTPAAKPAADPPQAKHGKNWAQPSAKGGNDGLNVAYLQNLLANVNPKEREKLLSDKKVFHRFVENQADAMAVLEAARANKVQNNQDVKFLMQRAAQNVLREIYLNKLIASKIPKDFPTDKQMQDYYNKNKSKFVIGERMHVWQIFLPLTKGMNKKQKANVEKQADKIVKELKDGKTTFAEAALKYSANAASRNNGGYMGLVQVSEMKPGIQAPLLALKEGQVSAPIKADDGVHILKRGGTVPGRNIALDEVKPQVRRLLINQARRQLLQAIYAQARKTYPVALTDNQVEEWRLRLRTDLKDDSGKAASKGK